jgi:hypothetical protein
LATGSGTLHYDGTTWSPVGTPPTALNVQVKVRQDSVLLFGQDGLTVLLRDAT